MPGVASSRAMMRFDHRFLRLTPEKNRSTDRRTRGIAPPHRGGRRGLKQPSSEAPGPKEEGA